MPKKIVSEISGIVFSLPWLVARDEGLFAAEGLQVELVRAQGARPDLQKPREAPVHDHQQVESILGHTLFEEGKVELYRA